MLLDLRLVQVDRHDVQPRVGELDRQRQADIAQADRRRPVAVRDVSFERSRLGSAGADAGTTAVGLADTSWDI